MTIKQWVLCTAFAVCSGLGCGNVKPSAADAPDPGATGDASTVSDAAVGGDAPVACGVLPFGAQLDANDTVTSCDGRFHVRMQTDGNLVLYQANGPLWGSGTAGKGGAVARMQADGDLVVATSSGAVVWDTNTAGHAGAYGKVQDDGNLVVYSPSGSSLWATGTTTPCGCYVGNGDYCGSAVIERAVAVHCVLPFGFSSGDLYHCMDGSWLLKQACTQGCTVNGSGTPDTCTP